MRAELAHGPVLDVSKYELRGNVKSLGAVDVDGDGRWEVFVDSGPRHF